MIKLLSINWLKPWPTAWHTSLIRLTVISWMSLWRIDGNRPLGQLRACSTLNWMPHTQWDGRHGGCQPYLRHRVSLKAPLCAACSAMGKADSQLEAPFSDDMPFGSFAFTSAAALVCCYWQKLRVLFLALGCAWRVHFWLIVELHESVLLVLTCSRVFCLRLAAFLGLFKIQM